jgi:hypothetical protein
VSAPAVEFHTSIIGRIAWLSFALVGVFGLLFMGMGLHGGVLERGWLIAVLSLLLTAGFGWYFLYSLWFFLWPGWRVRCDEQGISFAGLLGAKTLKWSEIQSYRLGGHSFIDIIDLRVAGRRRAYTFNITGLQPDYAHLGWMVGQKVGG